MAATTAPASLAYDGIPIEERTAVLDGILYLGEVTVLAGMGGVSAKGLSVTGICARKVLGLPMPGEDAGVRHDPGRVLWVSSGTEDDPMRDLAGRFASALAALAAQYGVAPADAALALRYFHDLSAWPSGDPVEVPQDMARIRAEVAALNELDAANRAPAAPGYGGPGPAVAITVFDPLDALLGEGATVDSRAGARRVMGRFGQFARGADVSALVIHHVIGNGRKIAGSPAITNSVRLAFIASPDAADARIASWAPVKSNISAGAELRYQVIPASPAPYARFLDDAAALAGQGTGDTLRERIAAHDSPAAMRRRVRAAAGAGDRGPAGPAGPAGYQVMRQQGTERTVIAARPGQGQARAAAEEDAGAGMAWNPVAGKPGWQSAAARVSGTPTGYLVRPSS
jgi:AAA domain-containing protein